VLVVQVDDVAVAMALGRMPVRVPVRLGSLPALVLMLVVFVVHVQVRVLERPVLMLEHLRVVAWP
jgi:hypothetical protein